MVAIEFFTVDQDKQPRLLPGRVRMKVQYGLRTANSANVLAEFSIKAKSEESRQWCLVGKDRIWVLASVKR